MSKSGWDSPQVAMLPAARIPGSRVIWTVAVVSMLLSVLFHKVVVMVERRVLWCMWYCNGRVGLAAPPKTKALIRHTLQGALRALANRADRWRSAQNPGECKFQPCVSEKGQFLR